MCGRAVCSLAPEEICRLCACQIGLDITMMPSAYPNYVPSFNFSPTNYGLILTNSAIVSGKHSAKNDVLLMEMKWGLIPSWSKGDQAAQMSYKMINARSDGLTQKPTFKKLLNEGRRCVFVVEGFYEWQETKNGKQPFYIHLQTDASIDQKFIKGEENVDKTPTNRMMFIAGLFDVNTHVEQYPVRTFTVITVPSSKVIGSIHDRMPAILPDRDSIRRWLDYVHVSVDEALKLLKPYEKLTYYPVSKNVNNVSYKDSDCIKRLVICEDKKPISRFFTKTSLPHKIEGDEDISAKKQKISD